MASKTDGIIAQEVMNQMTDFAKAAADTLPDQTYWIFSSLTILGPAILSEIRHADIFLPESDFIGPLWNYIDGGCSVVGGLLQLTDKYHHRPIMNKIKGLLNSLSGTQIITLTAINFALFGAPAFGAAAGVGFILNLDDMVRVCRRHYTFDYWVKDSLAELDTINTIIIPDLKKQIAELESINQNEEGKLTRWMLMRKKHRLEEFIEQKEQIEQDMIHRFALRQYSAIDEVDSATTKQHQNELRQFNRRIQDSLLQQNTHQDTHDFLKQLDSLGNEIISQDSIISFQHGSETKTLDFATCDKAEKAIAKRLKTDIFNACKNTFIWGIAFAGMLCLCFPIPPIQIVGLALVGLSTTLYLIKNIKQIGKGLVAMKDCFFKPAAMTNSQSNALISSTDASEDDLSETLPNDLNN